MQTTTTAMPNEPNDSMANLANVMNRAKERQKAGSAPFFFSIKEDERATVRFLLDTDQYVALEFHSLYNSATQKFEVSAVCAASFGSACQVCADAIATRNRKLRSRTHIYLPLYLHNVLHRQPTGQWTEVTYKDDQGQEHQVSGMRVLDMGDTSPLLASLFDTKDQGGTITEHDFVITRRGSGKDTTYSITPSVKPARVLPSDLVAPSRDKLRSDIEMERPMLRVGGVTAEEDQVPDIQDDFDSPQSRPSPFV